MSVSSFPKFHGIQLAQNAWFTNLVVENLSSDPVPLTAARIWYNIATKQLKFSSLDSGGAIITEVIATGAQVQAALDLISALGARVTSIEGSYIKKDGSVAFTGDVDAGSHRLTNVVAGNAGTDAVNVSQLQAAINSLANAFNYIGTVAGGVDTVNAFDMGTTTTRKVGSYYKVTTAGYFKVGTGSPFFANINDGLVFNTSNGVDIIDNTNSSVQGTANFVKVTGTADTGYTIDLESTFKTRVTTLESNLTAETARATAAENTLTTNLAAEATRAGGVESGLRSDLTAEVTRATAADQSNASAIASETTRAQNAESTLQANIDAEKARAQAAEQAAAGAGNTNAQAIAAETTRAQGIEGGLRTDLTAEVNRATAAEQAAQTAVTAEKNRAQGVEGDLTTLTGTDKTSLVNAINAESARARAAETSNSGAISAETTRAQAAEGTLTTNLAAEVTRATAAENANTTSISNEVTRATGAESAINTKIGDVTTLTTTDKTDLVHAINSVAAAAGTGTGALKNAINAQRFTYLAPTAALTHQITHNLNSAFVQVFVLVKGSDGLFRNDIVAVEETSSNVTTVTLTESNIIKVSLQALDNLA